MSVGLLLDFVLIRKGLRWTSRELNKVLGLSSVTVLLLAFLIPNERLEVRNNCMLSAVMLAVLHGLLSFYVVYDQSIAAIFRQWWVKQLSVLLGTLTLVVSVRWRLFGDFQSSPVLPASLVCACSALALGHFWTMEIDEKIKLKVRPFAYLPFALGLAVASSYAHTYIYT